MGEGGYKAWAWELDKNEIGLIEVVVSRGAQTKVTPTFILKDVDNDNLM